MTDLLNFFVQVCYIFNVKLKEGSNARQSCNYLINNTVKKLKEYCAKNSIYLKKKLHYECWSFCAALYFVEVVIVFSGFFDKYSTQNTIYLN